MTAKLWKFITLPFLLDMPLIFIFGSSSLGDEWNFFFVFVWSRGWEAATINIGFRLFLVNSEEILAILVILWVVMSSLIYILDFLVLSKGDWRLSLFFLNSLIPFFFQSFPSLLFHLLLTILDHFIFVINHYFWPFSFVFLLLQKDIFHFFKIYHHDQKPTYKRHK